MSPIISRCASAIVLISAGIARAGCPPPYSASGHATYYTSTGVTGACSMEVVSGQTTAIVISRWIGSAHCGECLNVHGPNGSVVVKVTDQCPDCTQSDLDMTQGAFAEIGNLADGIIPISWERVDCPSVSSLVLNVQDGSNAYYLSMLADDTRQGIADIAIKESGESNWQTLARLDYGYFNVQSTEAAGMAFPLSVRLTSESGQVLELDNALANANAGDRATTSQFTGCTDRIFASDFGSNL